MIKTDQLNKVFRTDEVETTALNQVSIQKGRDNHYHGNTHCL
jgi:hypothetical protein